jgi:hypothetical protein
MPNAIDILIRTYFRDFRWLTLSLLSVAQFVDGYRRIVIVMPESSFKRLRGDEIPARVPATLLCCPDYPDDYLGQQVSKLRADEFTDAPFVVHIDSDSIFRAACSLPALLTKNGRPVVRVLWCSRRRQDDGWRRCIADFFGEPLPFDVLAPPPYVYAAELYRSLRRNCVSRHGVTLDDWCFSRQFDSLSEFGLLAAQAWFHHRDDYCWVSADHESGWPCQPFWSRSPTSETQRAAIARQLDDREGHHEIKGS